MSLCWSSRTNCGETPEHPWELHIVDLSQTTSAQHNLFPLLLWKPMTSCSFSPNIKFTPIMQQQEVPVEQDESLGSMTAASQTDPSPHTVPTYNRFGINHRLYEEQNELSFFNFPNKKGLIFFPPHSSFIHATVVDRIHSFAYFQSSSVDGCYL